MHPIGRLRAIAASRAPGSPCSRGSVRCSKPTPAAKGSRSPVPNSSARFSRRRSTCRPSRSACRPCAVASSSRSSLLLGGTVLLLALASLNVAGLLLARGAARHREMRTRLAPGATRLRLVRQLLVESTLITLSGAALASRSLRRSPACCSRCWRTTATSPSASTAHLRVRARRQRRDRAALQPCAHVHVGRMPLIAALRERTPAGGRHAARKALVVAQLAVALVMLVSAGLFVETLARLRARGAARSRSAPRDVQKEPAVARLLGADAERAMREVLLRIQDVPGVVRPAITDLMLLGGFGASNSLTIDRRRAWSPIARCPHARQPGFLLDPRRQRDRRPRVRRPRRARRAASAAVSDGRSSTRASRAATSALRAPSDTASASGTGPTPRPTSKSSASSATSPPATSATCARTGVPPVLRPGLQRRHVLPEPDESSDAVLASVRQAVAAVDPALPIAAHDRRAPDRAVAADGADARDAVQQLRSDRLAALRRGAVRRDVVRRHAANAGDRRASRAWRHAGHALWIVARDASVMLAIGTSIALPAHWRSDA